MSEKKRLAIITTHPIQYYAPAFQLLHQRQKIEIKVFYTWGKAALDKHDPGFGKNINWDIPLLEGYPYDWVENSSTDPGSHHFKGIINPSLIAELKNWKPDAILVYGWAYDSHLKVLRTFKKKTPVFFRGDSTTLDDRKDFKSLLKSVFLRWVYSHVDLAIYTGINNKIYFKKYGLKESQLTFAPHAIDNNRFALARPDEAESFRSKLRLTDKDVLILFAGKFEPKKDPLILLDSFTALATDNCHLLYVGNGELESALKAKVAGNSGVHFLEFQNQQAMPVVYQACDLFCLPSRGPNETWGLAVNEAMAACKAVLVSDKAGCAADLVKDGYNGKIFKAGQVQSLTTCLKQLTKSKNLLSEFGLNSTKIIKDWTFTNMVKLIEDTVLHETK